MPWKYCKSDVHLLSGCERPAVWYRRNGAGFPIRLPEKQERQSKTRRIALGDKRQVWNLFSLFSENGYKRRDESMLAVTVLSWCEFEFWKLVKKEGPAVNQHRWRLRSFLKKLLIDFWNTTGETIALIDPGRSVKQICWTSAVQFHVSLERLARKQMYRGERELGKLVENEGVGMRENKLLVGGALFVAWKRSTEMEGSVVSEMGYLWKR